VIYYSHQQQKDTSFRSYFVRRWRRIFPIFIASLGLSLLCDGSAAPWNRAETSQFLGNLFMIQDMKSLKPGVLVGTFHGNTPLWSLSYEWWFYMMFFPIWRFVHPKWQRWLVAALSAMGLLVYWLAPNQAALFLLYFSLWWAGVELARTYVAGVAPAFRNQLPSLIILGLLCAALGGWCLIWKQHGNSLGFGIHPVLEFRHFAATFIFLCGGLLWARLKWTGFHGLLGVFSWVAPISYALYVFHWPLCFVTEKWTLLQPAMQVTASVVVATILAYLAEGPCQRMVNRVIR
jgi:peptidoglycan/LPS O-acetylase OafA/YrhL